MSYQAYSPRNRFDYENAVIAIKGLASSVKIVYGRLLNHCRNKWSCFPSLNCLVRQTGHSKRTIIKALRILVSKELIVIEKRKNPRTGAYMSNLYTICHQPEIDVAQMEQAAARAISVEEKAKLTAKAKLEYEIMMQKKYTEVNHLAFEEIKACLMENREPDISTDMLKFGFGSKWFASMFKALADNSAPELLNDTETVEEPELEQLEPEEEIFASEPDFEAVSELCPTTEEDKLEPEEIEPEVITPEYLRQQLAIKYRNPETKEAALALLDLFGAERIEDIFPEDYSFFLHLTWGLGK